MIPELANLVYFVLIYLFIYLFYFEIKKMCAIKLIHITTYAVVNHIHAVTLSAIFFLHFLINFFFFMFSLSHHRFAIITSYTVLTRIESFASINGSKNL